MKLLGVSMEELARMMSRPSCWDNWWTRRTSDLQGEGEEGGAGQDDVPPQLLGQMVDQAHFRPVGGGEGGEGEHLRPAGGGGEEEELRGEEGEAP